MNQHRFVRDTNVESLTLRVHEPSVIKPHLGRFFADRDSGKKRSPFLPALKHLNASSKVEVGKVFIVVNDEQTRVQISTVLDIFFGCCSPLKYLPEKRG